LLGNKIRLVEQSISEPFEMGPKTNKHAQEAREREAAKKEAQQVIAPVVLCICHFHF
jgi:hypothetical protein